MNYRLSLILIFILLISAIHAQDGDAPLTDNEELTFNVHGILSFPNSSFGTLSDNKTSRTNRIGLKIGDKIGLAETGFGIGAELNTPVWTEGMNWIVSAKILINPTNSTEIQSIYRSQWDDSVNVELDVGNWINLPLMTGLKYTFNLFNNFEFYGLAQGGANFSKAPSFIATEGSVTIEKTNYEFVTDYSVELSIGIIYNKTYNIAFSYFNGGTPRYRGTRELNPIYFPKIFDVKSDIIAEERSISMFTLTLGIEL
ncbi:MAG: hypothetical protein L3J41_08840 [Melioribacteraceae bacterium]|nr:hypothetical protein [Melioribacteraceae bacterium]